MRPGAKGRRAYPAARARQSGEVPLSGRASHDLRQPLHALGLFVAQLRSRLEAAEREQVIERVETSLAALNELFDALLDISKLDAGVLATNPVDFPITGCSKDLEQPLLGRQRERAWSLRIVPCSAWVRTDPILLERVLLTLFPMRCATRPGGRARWLSTSRRALDIEVWTPGQDPGGPAAENLRGVRAARRSRREGQPGLGLGTLDRPAALRSAGVADDVRICARQGLVLQCDAAAAPSQVGHHERPAEPATHHRHLGAARRRGGRR